MGKPDIFQLPTSLCQLQSVDPSGFACPKLTHALSSQIWAPPLVTIQEAMSSYVLTEQLTPVLGGLTKVAGSYTAG